MAGNSLKLLGLRPRSTVRGNTQGANEYIVFVECGETFTAARAMLAQLILFPGW